MISNNEIKERMAQAEDYARKIASNKPLLTKETALTAQTKIYYDNAKLLKALPSFTYNKLVNSIDRICKELRECYQLK